MSIWASSLIFAEDEAPAPIIYRQSHVLPSDTDPRGGSLDLAYVPGFITRDGRNVDGEENPDCDHEGVWPWLRLSVSPVQPPAEARRLARKGRRYRLFLRMYWPVVRLIRRCCARLGWPGPRWSQLIPSWSWPEDTVVLDRAQVEQLRDELSDWLLRCDDPDEWLEAYEQQRRDETR